MNSILYFKYASNSALISKKHDLISGHLCAQKM